MFKNLQNKTKRVLRNVGTLIGAIGEVIEEAVNDIPDIDFD